MTIKIVFDSFDEMMRYADRLKNGTLFDQTGKTVDEGPAQENLPEKKVEGNTAGNSIPYGWQIAPHFPNANVSQQPGAAAPGAVPTAAHAYTQDDLARAAMQLMDKGGMQQLQQLLAGYGCETLQQLPKEQYGNFATALRGMGAQI